MTMKHINHQQNSGFTLIEISFALLIVAILVLPAIKMYESYQQTKKEAVSKENVATAMSAVNSIAERYVCPSDKSIAPGSPDYGIENCDIASIPACTAALLGICKVQTTRDADNDGSLDFVVIGGVPMQYYESYDASLNPALDTLKSLPITSEEILDGWAHQLTYAVSANLMKPSKTREEIALDFRYGVISAVDEDGNPTAGIEDNAQFAVVSHGRNGLGTFTKYAVPVPCAVGEAETENCDQDSTFMSAIGAYENTGGNYYDDYSRFYMKAAGELWYNISIGGNTSDHIVHRNANNIGVNITTAPTTKLQVGGTIRADSVRSDTLCGPLSDPTAPCLNPTLFNQMPKRYGFTGAVSTTQSYCDDGQILEAISNGQLICSNPKFNAPGNEPRRCPAGTYVSEVQTNGCIICNNGSKICLP